MCTMHAYLLTYPRASTIGQRRCDLSHDLPANVTHNCMGPLFDRSWRSDGQGRGERGLQAAYCFLKDDGACSKHSVRKDCLAARSRLPGELGCFFFPATRLDSMRPQSTGGAPADTDEGECRAGLWSAQDFVHERGRALSLRHICGEGMKDETGCPAFNKPTQDILKIVSDVFTFLFVAEMVFEHISFYSGILI